MDISRIFFNCFFLLALSEFTPILLNFTQSWHRLSLPTNSSFGTRMENARKEVAQG
jgi:hypothetical protein